MNPFDLLVTFAELAVSYIGFASIVAAIQSLGGRTWEPLDKLLFRQSIEGSIVGVFLSIVPVSLSAAGTISGSTLIWVAIVSLSFLTLVFRFFPLGSSRGSA